MTRARIPLPHEAIAASCRRWQITELALFGSVLGGDFRPESDVDVLVRLGPSASRRFSDWLRMEEELEALFGRKVDLVSRRAVEESENWIRKRHVFSHMETVYVA